MTKLRLHVREPEGRRKPESLAILLHGYGANGQDLIGLADLWRTRLRDTLFVAPDAPEPLPASAIDGYQWFPLTFRDPDELSTGCRRAGPVVASLVQTLLQKYGLGTDRLALVGFSQGAMLALHVGLSMMPAPAAILAYSGVLADPDALVASQMSAASGPQPRIALVHGAADDVIPVDAIDLTREAVAAAGFSLEWHVIAGLGHGIDQSAVGIGADLLAGAFRGA
ncbi:MAG: alpha/beta hydrolase [Hyphomicrobiaceae bacterium]